MAKLKKSEKKMLIALGIVAVIGGIMLYRIYGPQDSEPLIISESIEEEKPVTTQRRVSSGGGGGGGGSRSSSSSTTSGSVIPMNEFQKHSMINDCWVLIDGVVYDVTNAMQKYPRQIGIASDFCGTVGFEVGFLGENDFKGTVIENSQRIGTIG